MDTKILDQTKMASLPGIDKQDDKNAAKYVTTDAETRIKKQKMEFLSMLTTQLKNQDPFQPMDTNNMAQQVMAMNSVEQQLETNKLLTSIHQLLSNAHTSSSGNVIGKLGYFEDGNTFLVSDKTKPVQLKFEAAGEVKGAILSVFNNKGQQVFTDYKNINAGLNAFDWKMDPSLPTGMYSYNVELVAKDDKKKDSLKVKTFGNGRIEGVISEKGMSLYEVNGQKIPSDKFTQIKDLPQTITPEVVKHIGEQLNKLEEQALGTQAAMPQASPQVEQVKGGEQVQGFVQDLINGIKQSL